jgi:transcriptional regulator with XRE-family HTH domain
MEISTLLRERREEIGLTQIELALRSGLSQATISAVERGRRQPSLTVVSRVLAALGLQLRLSTELIEHSERELDLAIDAALRTPALDRVTTGWFDGPQLMRLLAPVAPVIGGAAGAALHGAPVPLTVLDVAIERSRLDQFADVIRRSFAERWSEDWQQWGMAPADPRAPGAHRWRTLAGEFSVHFVDEQPEGVTVLVGDLPVAVRPLHEIEAAEPHVRRALDRLRQRGPSPLETVLDAGRLR